MILREGVIDHIQRALDRSRVVALVGPRQCGKTTLARQFLAPDSLNYFDLEDPTSLARLTEPLTALQPLRGLVVIDEIQRIPALYPILRVLADREGDIARFLILGSASPSLVKHASESLAGRIETIALGGFAISELGSDHIPRHWNRGGFPPSFLAGNDEDSLMWRRSFIQTFVERDVPLVGFALPPEAILPFWTMVAHYHGQIWNSSEISRSMGVSDATVRRYVDLLSGFFMLRALQPWHVNLQKRQVKSPKVYIRDTGVLHALLGISSERDLQAHPKLGASWEGYVIEETLKRIQPEQAYFWATHQGAELDLLLIKDGETYGIEVKRQDAPRVTPSMRIALEDLGLRCISVLYPGDRLYTLGDRINVVPLSSLADRSLDWLRGSQ